MKRRVLLAWATGALGAALGLVVAVPGVGYLLAPARRKAATTDPVDVGELAALPDGRPVRVPLRVAAVRDAWLKLTGVVLGAAWLRRDGERVTAFSTVCPHAGCAVDWDAQGGCFRCPCHESVFAPDGARLSGPAPRGLDPLEVSVENGHVRVLHRRFRAGVAGREPA
jgi:Rieske Fe-S protein